MRIAVLNTSFFNRNGWYRLCLYLSGLFLSLGIVVRIVQYLSNRSLWGDEVNLALNIIDRSYLELSQTLDYNQAAPLGFLWLEKLATQIFGNSEYALRLLPFTASIASLGVFYRLTRLYSSSLGGVIATALFACGRYTLYFATELKPYSSDVAIALILFWLLSRVNRRLLRVKGIIGLAIVGSLAIWLSYPSVFVLAGLEAVNFTASRKYWYKILVNRIGIYLTWIVSFGLFYFFTIADTLTNEDLSSSWSSRYPDSFGDILWLFDALGRFFYHPMGFSGIADGIGMFAFIVGSVAWYRRNPRIYLALIAPFIVTLFAAYLRQYPFRDRLVLFLAPLGILIVAEGIILLLTQLRKINLTYSHRWNWLFGLLGIVCLYTLTVPAILRASNFIIHPEQKHEVRPVVEYVAAHDRPGDKIYVYAGAVQAFAYYVDLKDYSDLNSIYGSANFSQKGNIEETRSQFAREIEPLLGQRVWFVFRAEEEEELVAVEYLDAIARQLDSFPQPGASAYLYRL